MERDLEQVSISDVLILESIIRYMRVLRALSCGAGCQAVAKLQGLPAPGRAGQIGQHAGHLRKRAPPLCLALRQAR